MSTILVIYFASSIGLGIPASITMQEFSSPESCQAAATAIYENVLEPRDKKNAVLRCIQKR